MPLHSDLPPWKLRLSDEDRRALLSRARQAISEVVCQGRLADLPPVAGRLAETGGAFVTVLCEGRLRGCMGRAESPHSLADTVEQCAINASRQDPRFRPLQREEMARLEIEISVLSELQPISPDEIETGIHGIVVTRGACRGVLLPQVAVERSWSAQRFLEEACVKAGLQPDAWRDPETKLFAFTAHVFSEAGLRSAAQQPAGF
jgi:AmmeMemoRadiSam system protein A